MPAASAPNYRGPVTLGQARSLFSLAECSDAAFFVIRGWITFHFAGKDVNMPASFGTWDPDGPAVAAT